MNNTQKQIVARLVAEKVWGFMLNRKGSAYLQGGQCKFSTLETAQKVFSWPGFGETYEWALRAKWWPLIFDNEDGRTLFMLDNTETQTEGYEITSSPDKTILACHLAALDALGIDWRKELEREGS